MRISANTLAAALVGALASAASVYVSVAADNYPSRNITAIIPFAAGNANDVTARIVFDQLSKQLNQPINDPAQARRTAAKALQDINEAIKQQVKNNSKFAEAQQDAKMVRQLQVPQDEKGPVADALQGARGQAEVVVGANVPCHVLHNTS